MLYKIEINTPLGLMVGISNDAGICALEFADKKNLNVELVHMQNYFGAPIVTQTNCHLEQLQLQLNEYFAGNRKQFDLPLQFIGTLFQQKSWQALQTINYGATQSYKQQATKVGNLKAVRAVASANAHNRLAIIVPCHRVIGSDGKLTGYAGQLWRKQWLLDWEKKMLNSELHS
jgi:AraC family transcriptional regulator of adaptative response/methylated-DNA-[protein]-cysteine methyltransferase